MLPTHAFCPNCQRVRQVEKVRSQHLFDAKKSQIKLKCVDCGYVAGVRVKKNPVLKGGVQKLATGEYYGALLNDKGWIMHEKTGALKDLVENNLRAYADKHGYSMVLMNPVKKKVKKQTDKQYKAYWKKFFKTHEVDFERGGWKRKPKWKQNYPKKSSVVRDFRGPVKKGKRTIIYDKITAIQAVKGNKSLWPHEHFEHKFSKGAEVLGNPDGSLTVKSKNGKRLWKNIDYKKGDVR